MRAYVGVGANLGDTNKTLSSVPAALAARSIFVSNASSIFLTAPVGGPPGQPDFLNQVLEVRTLLTAREMLAAFELIEFAFGRDRQAEERHGPRPLDLDLLAIEGGTVIDEPGLHVPHPRLHERAFVLVPLAELAPELEIPGHGTVASLLLTVDTSGVKKL